MTIDISVSPERQLAYFHFSGTVTVADCADAFRRYLAHPLFDPAYMMLSDTRDLEGIEASFLGIVVAVERLLPSFLQFRKLRSSVIHAPGDVAFGMARMMQQVTEPVSNFRFEICRDESTSLCAAGQPDASLDDLRAALARGEIPEMPRAAIG